VTSIDVGAEKPNPRIFEAVLRRLGVKPDQALMIGNDLVQDIEGAKAIGLRTGWFTGTPKHHVDSADFSFSDFGDLPQLIAALEQSSGGYRDDKHSRRKSS
jgi:putative hydrolase of the HAD superfamily